MIFFSLYIAWTSFYNGCVFRVILGRSHIKAVAENRKTEIEKFLHELFITSPEISHVSVVNDGNHHKHPATQGQLLQLGSFIQLLTKFMVAYLATIPKSMMHCCEIAVCLIRPAIEPLYLNSSFIDMTFLVILYNILCRYSHTDCWG